ncbi:MAG: response regulator [Firmicutes bacterium]|nr:response regulator [Bacillota bacterium]
MRAIIVDDEQMAIENLRLKISGDERITEVETFRSPLKALDYLRENDVDIAFLDINMPVMDGLTMAKGMKEIRPDCSIVFVTGYSEYSVEAYRLHVSGYLMKPASAEDIKNEIDFAISRKKNPAPVSEAPLRVQCFGNFEVFVSGVPAKFKYTKTKELFAYLICAKGKTISNDELCSVLWEEEEINLSKKSYFRNMISDLQTMLKDAGSPDVLIKQRSALSIVPDKIECDYFSWLQGDPIAINAYRGEFMIQYSWSEFSLGEF